jgi:hypothetical protein
VLGAEVVVPETSGFDPGKAGGGGGRSGDTYRSGARLHVLPPLPGAAAGAVLLVDGLLGDAQAAGDLLPGPAVGAGVVDLQDF